jgi:CubicO group peptidase (beta-lactamase class C family)
LTVVYYHNNTVVIRLEFKGFEMRILVPATAASALMMAAHASALPAGFNAKADAVLNSAFAADAPGAAAIVVDDGKVVYASGRGLADVAARKAITPDTVFRLGSITKQFTAAVILQLVEEGKVSLADPVSKYLPDYPKPGADATISQLLNHTSGIQSYTGIPGWMASQKPAQAFTTNALVAEFKDMPVQFERGTRYEYNNSGYVLLGAVIEKVTGKPWHDAVIDRIAKPLGLTTIRYAEDERTVPAMAAGYTKNDGKIAPSRPIHMSVPHAAGALIGTVGDLAKWSQALHHGKVVKSDTYKQMIAPTKLVDGKEEPYAFGLANDDLRGRHAVSHGGGIFGFSTFGIYVPSEDVFVAVFANSDDPSASPTATSMRLAALAINDPYPVFTKADIPVAKVEPLLGIYKVDGGERRFFARDGKLFTQRTGNPALEVVTAGGDRFYYADSLSWFAIERDAGGKPLMQFHTNGAPKAVAAAYAGPIPPEVVAKVAKADLERLAGTYQGPAPIVVAMAGEGLTLKFGDQPITNLVPESSTMFRVKEVDAKVEFKVEGGTVSQLLIHQGGRSLPAKRSN